MQKLVRWAGLALATVVIAINAPVAAQAAGPIITLSDDGTNTCLKPNGSTVWGASGAFPRIKVTDKIQWLAPNQLKMYSSNSTGTNVGCYNGYKYGGGKMRLVTSWLVTGIALGSCDVGTGNVGCTGSTSTKEYAKYDSGSKTSDGDITYNRGGDTIYATSTGSIYDYEHKASVTFSYGGDAQTAGVNTFTGARF